MTPKTPQSADLFSAFRRLIKSERGAIAIVMALSLPVLMAFAGLGTEAGYWYLREAQLQGFSDAAAYASGHELISGAADSVIAARAHDEAYRLGLNEDRGKLQLFSPPRTGKYAGDADAVEVVVREIQPRLFTKAFLKEDIPIGARTVVRVNEWEDACVLTLDPIASGAISTFGSASVGLDGCTMMSNSIDDRAIVVGGTAELTASCVATAGGTFGGGDLNLTDCSGPQTGVKPASDPFAGLPEPIPSAPCKSVPAYTGTTITLSPGTYCGDINIAGHYRMDPGTYIFDGGHLAINSTTELKGNGVTLAFVNGADVTINGSAEVQLTAPTSGTYSGILVFGSRADASAIYTLNGNSDSFLEGAIYTPAGEVRLLGAANVDTDCLMVVSATAVFGGDVKLSNDCVDYNLDDIRVAGILRIVE